MAESKPLLTVALLGATSAGKTTLSVALARETQSQEAEAASALQRGVVVHQGEPTLLSYQSEARRYTHADPSGHEQVITYLWGLSHPTDAAILVINSAEGCGEQTRAQLGLAKALGLPAPLLLINLVGQEDEEWLDAIEREARESLEALGFSGNEAPCLRGDLFAAAYDGSGLAAQVLNALDACFQVGTPLAARPLRAVSLGGSYEKRRASVLIKIIQGSLRVGAVVEVVGQQASFLAAVERIEAGARVFTGDEEVIAGQDATCILRTNAVDSGFVGRVLAAPDTLRSYVKVRAQVYALPVSYHGIEQALTPDDEVMMALHTLHFPMQVALPVGPPWRPGEQREVMLTLPRKTIVEGFHSWSFDPELDPAGRGHALELGTRFWVLRGYRQWGLGMITETIEEG